METSQTVQLPNNTTLYLFNINSLSQAERKIPINYASRFQASMFGLDQSSYLPLKVNTAGIMPVIFASSFLALPTTLARFTGFEPKELVFSDTISEVLLANSVIDCL